MTSTCQDRIPDLTGLFVPFSRDSGREICLGYRIGSPCVGPWRTHEGRLTTSVLSGCTLHFDFEIVSGRDPVLVLFFFSITLKSEVE